MEENVLSILCGGALEQWLGRLREDVTEEDCQDLLVVASAWTALAGMTGALEQSQPTPLSFSAGDLTVRAREDRTGDACARSLQSQAERLMEPYVQDGVLPFGVEDELCRRFQAIAAVWPDGDPVAGREIVRRGGRCCVLCWEARQFVPTLGRAGKCCCACRASAAGGTTGRLGFAAGGEVLWGAERERRGGGTGADLLAGRSGQAGGRCDMTTLATIRQAMTAFLAEAGIEALSAWPKEVWKGRKTPVAVVQVKEVEAGASGFQNYLGQTYDPAARQWTERYGRRITVKFGVTLYSPEAAGESGCQALLEQVAQALMERGPAGFAVEKWSAGETAFDQASGMFWGKLQAVCRGMLVAGMEESGELEGFTVRGEVTL
ncbi:MAG: hypothetical protein ACLS43_06575 [Evtepia gabavorous]